MAATPAPNPRASLLAGLRTGGVRSASGPVPHTAAPAGTFNIPRIVTPNMEDNYYPPEEEEDELSNMMSQNLYIQNARSRQAPVTAAVDGIPNRFQHQQQQSYNMNGGGMPFNNMMSPAMTQNQLQQVQLQLMQMEFARMQVCLSANCGIMHHMNMSSRLCKPSSTKLSCLRLRLLSSASASSLEDAQRLTLSLPPPGRLTLRLICALQPCILRCAAATRLINSARSSV